MNKLCLECVCVCVCYAAYIQAVRGLLMSSLCFGLIGTVLTFFGMECTRIGGNWRSNDRLLITASVFHVVGCEYQLFASLCKKQLLRTSTHWFVFFFSMSSALPHAGASAVAGYCLYINRVVAAFLHSKADPSKLR